LCQRRSATPQWGVGTRYVRFTLKKGAGEGDLARGAKIGGKRGGRTEKKV